MNYCLFFQTIKMAITIAAATTARNVKSKKSAVISRELGAKIQNDFFYSTFSAA